MCDISLVSIGAPVVSRDGVRLGEVQNVAEAGILFGRDFGPLIRVSADHFCPGKTGVLQLRLDAADVREPSRRKRLGA